MQLAVTAEEFWYGSGITAIIGLIGLVVKQMVELKKMKLHQAPIDNQTLYAEYQNLLQELKGQIQGLQLENKQDREECNRRIAELEARHRKQIEAHKEESAQETRELRFRVKNLEAELERYREKEARSNEQQLFST